MKADTDGDGLGDGAEVRTYRSDPLPRDTDGDGLTDDSEVRGNRVVLNVRALKHKSSCGRWPWSGLTRACGTPPRDGLTDAQELRGTKNRRFATKKVAATNPLVADTDRVADRAAAGRR
jgi:hypothetical protein